MMILKPSVSFCLFVSTCHHDCVFCTIRLLRHILLQFIVICLCAKFSLSSAAATAAANVLLV